MADFRFCPVIERSETDTQPALDRDFRCVECDATNAWPARATEACSRRARFRWVQRPARHAAGQGALPARFPPVAIRRCRGRDRSCSSGSGSVAIGAVRVVVMLRVKQPRNQGHTPRLDHRLAGASERSTLLIRRRTRGRGVVRRPRRGRSAALIGDRLACHNFTLGRRAAAEIQWQSRGNPWG